MNRRRDLIAWTYEYDMERLEELDKASSCAVCGKPVKTYSLSFHAPLHLKCCVRLWEGYDASSNPDSQESKDAEAALDRLKFSGQVEVDK